MRFLFRGGHLLSVYWGNVSNYDMSCYKMTKLHANCRDREETTGESWMKLFTYIRMQPCRKTNLEVISFTVAADILWTRFPSSGCVYSSQTLLFPQGANTALPLGGPGREKHTGQSGGLTIQFWYNHISELKKKSRPCYM